MNNQKSNQTTYKNIHNIICPLCNSNYYYYKISGNDCLVCYKLFAKYLEYQLEYVEAKKYDNIKIDIKFNQSLLDKYYFLLQQYDTSIQHEDYENAKQLKYRLDNLFT